MTINALIFDWGGVLMRTANPASRREADRRLGLPPRGIDRLVFGHPLWQDTQMGRISSDAFWAGIAEQLGLDDASLAQFQADFWGGDRLDEDLVALIRHLRGAGYRTALLSNNPASLEKRIDDLGVDVFEVSIISGREGVMKPDPAIYELALQRLGVSASEAVFVDDYPANVTAAQKVGLHAVRFRGLAPLRRSLEELGVAVPPVILDPLPDIQAVIFDWGGVLERAPDAAHLAQWEQQLGLEPGLLPRVLWREVGYQLEVGEITSQAYAQHVADRLELPDAAAGARLVEQIFTNDWQYDEMIAAVRALRERYKVALLSNAFAEQAAWIQRLYGLDLHAEFDVYVNSALVGLRKPDWAIFRLTLEQLGVEAGQALFVDDSLRNVDAAQSLGIHALQCVDPATTLAELSMLLGGAEL